jgi:hypothetical protein
MPTKNTNISSVSVNNNGYTYRVSGGIPFIEMNSEINNDFWDLLVGKPANKSKPATPSVKRIVYHDPATIVFWQDGTKTVVKCMDGEPFEKYAGFCAALAKKVFGSTSKAKKVAGAKKKEEVEE